MASSRNFRFIDSTRIAQAVLDSLQSMVRGGQTVAIAYSGGLDSTVLLHAAKSACRHLDVSLSACHVHHGLSLDADAWVEHCEAQCRQLEVPLEVVRVEVDRKSPQGLEAAAREARYRVLDGVVGDWILLAHHRDDQAETLLFNLFRGTGVRGAGAMTSHRGRYLRPLLKLSRTEIEAYARSVSLHWIEDGSNSNTAFSRNFIRHRLLPLAETRFPRASATVARAAEAFDEMRGLLDDLARIDGGDNLPLPLELLRRLEKSRAANLLAYTLRRNGVAVPSRKWLTEALRQLLESAEDKQPIICIGKQQLRRHAQAVWLVPAWDIPAERVWDGVAEIDWGDAKIRPAFGRGAGIARQQLAGPLAFKPRAGGERFQLASGAAHRSLKDMLREAGIPPWWRERLPLLYCGEQLVWVPGIGVADNFRCHPEEDGIQLEFVGASW